MRIAIDARMLDAPFTGVGIYTKNLIKSLLNGDSENEYVLVVSRIFDPEVLASRRFTTITWPYRPFSLRSVFLLHRALADAKVDLFHSTSCVVPLLASCPVVVTIFDLMAIEYPGFFVGRSIPSRILGRTYFKLFMSLSIRKARGILAISKQVRSDLADFIPSCQQRISVTYMGVQPSFRGTNQEEKISFLRERFNLEGKVVFYLGSTRPHKNIPRLIKAFWLMASRMKEPCNLVIAGEKDKNLSLLENLVNELKLSDRVAFLHHLSPQDVVQLMSAVDIFAFPSLYEGFGLPILEAMACGTPVIASNAAAIPEVVGDAGLLVDPRDEQQIAFAMERLLTDGDLRKRLVEKGYQRVRLFTWSKTAEQTKCVYRQVMAGPDVRLTLRKLPIR